MFRRTFLSLSVLPLISGTAIASTLKSVDLLIVGAGAAGLAAACRAAELGIKNVVIIEKEPLIGGSSILLRYDSVEPDRKQYEQNQG